MSQLNDLERTDQVMIIVDSVGNLASKKEVDDALDGKSVADMTRLLKQMKSLFRMITPHLTLKDIPAVVVNHTYKEIGLFPKDIVSGGTGIYYSADNIFIIGRQQEKKGTDVVGYNFIINVEKSRYVREKSKIPIEVSWEGGISKWSGLLDMGNRVKFTLSNHQTDGMRNLATMMRRNTELRIHILRSSGCRFSRSILCRLDNSKVSYFL